MCEMYGLPVVYSGDESNEENRNTKWPKNQNTSWGDEEPTNWSSEEATETTIQDKVILETEITLRSGSNITMKIHEESRSNSINGLTESEEDARKMGVIRVLTEDSESDLYEEARKTPRKVRFGGEQVKMRTPESDSSAHTDNEEQNIHKRRIDLTAVQHELSSIKITLTDAVTIRTKKSLIPVRVTSLPSTPKRKSVKSEASLFPIRRRLHKSTPNLVVREAESSVSPSRIPRIKRENLFKVHNQKTISNNSVAATPSKFVQSQKTENQTWNKTQYVKIDPKTNPKLQQNSPKQIVRSPSAEISSKTNLKLKPIENSREKVVRSPVIVHNPIEILHNLSRSPERSRRNSLVNEPINGNLLTNDEEIFSKEDIILINAEKEKIGYFNSFQIVNTEDNDPTKTETNQNIIIQKNNNTTDEIALVQEAQHLKVSYCSFEVFNADQVKEDKPESVIIEEIVDEENSTNETNYRAVENSLQRSVSSLTSDDELWAKSEALDSVVKMLKEPGTCQKLEPGPASLLLEALFACHHRDRLHNLADDALKLLIEGLRQEVLYQCLSRVASAICKMGAPSGVRLAIGVMKKCSPKSFQNEILEKGMGHRTREGALQVLLACLKLFPSTDVEVQKIAECAAASLNDRRRKVRHAALEVLAVIAQIAPNFDILETVEKLLDDLPEKEKVLQVVRTRLSRKQLPTVDLDGAIRYATPVDPIELEWLSDVTFKHTKLSNQSNVNLTNNQTTANERVPSAYNATNKIKTEDYAKLTNENQSRTNRFPSATNSVNKIQTNHSNVNQQHSSTPSSSASSSTRSVNYWMHNSRHDQMCSCLPSIEQEDSAIEYKNDIRNEQPVIWALDSTEFTRSEQRHTKEPNGVLRPVYILQPDSIPTVNGRGYRRYDRGRSFSPPTRQTNQNGQQKYRNQGQNTYESSTRKDSYGKDRTRDSRNYKQNRDGYSRSWQGLDGFPDSTFQGVKVVNAPNNRENHQRHLKEGFSRDHAFRKSFSSDTLYHLEKQQEKHKSRAYEPHSHSLSSNSSTTSTGSSSRLPSFWHKSGIPIPIASERLRIKTKQHSIVPNNGPMVALRTIPTANSQQRTSPHDTPGRQDDDRHQLPLPLPPRSSGSESSGYFTPPPGSGGDSQPAFLTMNSVESKEGTSSDEVDHAGAQRNSSSLSSRRSSKDFVESSPRAKTPSYVLEDLENNNDIYERKQSARQTPHEEHFGEALNNNISNEPSSPNTTKADEVEILRTSRRNTPTPAPLILAGTTSEIVPVKRKSKSVAELQSFLPEINPSGRKTTNSAPHRKTDEEDLQCWDIDITDFTTNKQEDDVFDDIRKDIINAQIISNKENSINFPVETKKETNESKSVSNPVIVPSSNRFERRFSRNNSKKSLKATPSPRVDPFAKPKDALQLSLNQMESNEWETTIQGLQSLMRIARNHPEVVESQMHTVCLGLARHVKNLRSQVARIACQTAGELFVACKRGLDMELEEIAGPLLQRTADTNKFLRADANSALDRMCEHLPLHRVIPLVTIRGCSHQNAVVRATSMRLLCKLVNAFGADKSMNIPKELRDKLILAGANSLADGNLEARHQGKAMFAVLMGYPGFQRVLNEVVPQNLLRHIAKTMATIK